MQSLIAEIQKRSMKKKVPDLRPGQTVRIHQKIIEGDKERTQMFEGLVIKIGSGMGVDKTFTVRKVVEGIGVEKTYPFHSPNVLKIEIKKASHVRRARLYYMRGLEGKATRLREKTIKGETEEREAAIAELAEQKAKENAEKSEAKPA